MTQSQDWDALSDHFNTYKPDPDRGVLANIEQTWPVLEPLLTGLGADAVVLDFGCGTGALCRRFANLGFCVHGCDISPHMLEIARANTSPAIQYCVSDGLTGTLPGDCALITALMVFQFIEDPAPVLAKLAASLRPGGLLWFAVHHEHYVSADTNRHTRFEKIREVSGRRTAEIVLGGRRLTTYVSSAVQFDSLCAGVGLRRRLEWCSLPYADGTPGKYLVMAFENRGE